MTLENNMSQGHGIIWENEVHKIFDKEYVYNNREKYDIVLPDKDGNNGENISIKVTGGNNIDCGDIERFYNYDFTKKCTIMVIKYKQSNDNKIITNCCEINYTKEMRDMLFGSITPIILKEYVDSIKAFPPGKITDKSYLKTKRLLEKNHNMKIGIRPKIDSKNQRRVQCAIPKFADLCKSFITYDSSNESIPNMFRGKIIPLMIKSAKRARK